MGEKRDQVLFKSRKSHRGQRYIEWRYAVMNQGSYRCCLCGSTAELTADHIKPVVNYPELAFDVKNGRILCEPCRLKDMLASWEEGKFERQR
ncbi:hypothetical protein LCGC14_0629260 [marine sediment metagenome]|uniref:HNH nuclease domain-containing protein n=1 Tax=marine sediment metagenome TaxID=412755 RepID=A0A0F9TNS9_9ZZZZ